jgi:hypothetical protein
MSPPSHEQLSIRVIIAKLLSELEQAREPNQSRSKKKRILYKFEEAQCVTEII